LKTIYFCTTSASKLAQFRAFFAHHGFSVEQVILDIPEVQSIDVEEVVKQKLSIAAQQCPHRPLIVDDAGLEVEGLDGFPGALLKPILEKGGVGLLKSLSSAVSSNERSHATMVAAVAVALKSRMLTAKGKLSGVMDYSETARLADKSCSASFFPEHHDKSLATMHVEIGERAFSHRWQALEKMVHHIQAEAHL
jgi:non-canonical purine NTP pyrophosphatase (RdgB/HAM1 family)